MSISLTVPKEYGYVLLAAASTSALNIWLGAFVGSYRKAARVPYPNAYATATEAAASKEKYLFNCAQRSHAQFIEQLPAFLITLLVSGLRYPVVSAGLGAFWLFCRVLYAIGYTRPQFEGGKGRYWGSGYYIPSVALLVMSGMTGWSMVSS
ncbi:hypothetical protein MMC34_001386 [Xylographa carneopallida]|nr:hypothetical protein [Xylographa carneopallida]